MKRLFTVIVGALMALASCTITPVSEQPQLPVAAVKEGGALALFPILDAKAGSDQNIIYSPASVSQAFGLLQLGADGDTLAQLQSILPAPADAAWLESKGQDVEVSLANALWLSRDFRFRESYVAATRQRYDAVAEQIDVSDPQGTADRINAWADRETRGLIPSITERSAITSDLVAMLTNALYFDGKWDTTFVGGANRPFLFGDGYEAPFYLMRKTETYKSADRGGLRALRLPYRNPRYAMDVIMPAERTVMDKAPALERIAALDEALEIASARPTRVSLPCFQIEWQAGLVPVLETIGLTLPFGDAANLSRMAEPGQQPIKVSAVQQMARLQVFEEGTKAAAVTSVSIVVTSAPPMPFNLIDFTVDRPFVIVLRDLERGEVLFIGRIAAPKPYTP